jgi:3-methyladenine DNA glycosylase/8-oxoguanine DNA glycosylase
VWIDSDDPKRPEYEKIEYPAHWIVETGPRFEKRCNGVIEEMFRRWPNPSALAAASDNDLEDLIRPLGMQRKRTQTLKRMSAEYAAGGWKQAKELHGIGKYGDDAYRIFILGDWRAVQPNDHALTDYHEHLRKTLGDGNT